MSLRSVRIERFKTIADAAFELGPVNVLVGANNSGKSSIIQGLHFAIAVLQTVDLLGNWRAGAQLRTSLNPTQLIDSPSDDVYALGAGGRLLEQPAAAIRFTLILTTGEQIAVSIRKGRNRNILVAIENASAARRLASLERPFSVFSPGLAGIAKSELYVSDGVLLRTIARGDANLVLRNILCRLWSTPDWDAFLTDLRQIFPDGNFNVRFQPETDETIAVSATVGTGWVPIELIGTGVLQAAQILAYIHRFSPSLVVLDEPDSHLHPNNQRLLCTLLRNVAAERNTQIVLTTHSRHVVDATGGTAHFFWVRSGIVEQVGPDDEIGVLLDIGALDVKERAARPGTRFIVLTEDTDARTLEMICSASGFDLAGTVIMPYHGVTTIKHLRPLIAMVRATNPDATIIVHQDRDYLRDAEVEHWHETIRRLGVEPWTTDGVDIEGHLLQPDHLAACNAAGEPGDFARLIENARATARDDSVQHYVNGRLDVERAAGNASRVNLGQLAVEAARAVDGDLVRFSHGKTVVKRLRRAYQQEFRTNMRDGPSSDHLAHPELVTIRRRVGERG